MKVFQNIAVLTWTNRKTQDRFDSRVQYVKRIQCFDDDDKLSYVYS